MWDDFILCTHTASRQIMGKPSLRGIEVVVTSATVSLRHVSTLINLRSFVYSISFCLCVELRDP